MEIINYILKIIIVLFMFIFITRVWMFIANYIGKDLGISKCVLNAVEKIRRKK